MSYDIKFNLGNKTNQISINVPIEYSISFDFAERIISEGSWAPDMILIIMNYYIYNAKIYSCPIYVWRGAYSIIRDNFIKFRDVGNLINVLKSNYLTFKSESDDHLLQYKNNTWTHELWTYNETTAESIKNGIIELKLDDVSKAQFAKALSEYLILEKQYVRKIKLMNNIRNYKK